MPYNFYIALKVNWLYNSFQIKENSSGQGPQPISECEPSDCPVEVDWLRFRRVVSYITVASDATVSLTFTDDNFTGKDK